MVDLSTSRTKVRVYQMRMLFALVVSEVVEIARYVILKDRSSCYFK